MFRNRNNQQLNECNAAPICSIYFPNNAENDPRHPHRQVTTSMLFGAGENADAKSLPASAFSIHCSI